MKNVLRATSLILILALVFMPATDAFGLSAEQKRIFNSGVYYFDAEACTPAGSTTGTGSLSAGSKAETEELIFWFFVSKGYTKEQSAGILGNMWVESELEPRLVQYNTRNSRGEVSIPGQPSSIDDRPANGGYGLVQFTPGTKILPSAQRMNKPPGDLGFQLDLIAEQLNGESELPEKAAGDHLKQQATVDDSTKSFLDKYERAGVRHLSKRQELGRRVHETYRDKEPPEGITVPTSPGGGSISSCAGGNSGAGTIIDGFTLYNQYDSRWADRPFGSSTVARSGCGPSSLAMVISTFGNPVTPDVIAEQFSRFHGSTGSDWGIFPAAAEAYSLNIESIGTDMSRAIESLRNGGLVIASGRGPKPFTGGGHILVLRGVTDTGKILIGDSGHSDTSEKEWEAAELSASIRGMWIFTK